MRKSDSGGKYSHYRASIVHLYQLFIAYYVLNSVFLILGSEQLCDHETRLVEGGENRLALTCTISKKFFDHFSMNLNKRLHIVRVYTYDTDPAIARRMFQMVGVFPLIY